MNKIKIFIKRQIFRWHLAFGGFETFKEKYSDIVKGQPIPIYYIRKFIAQNSKFIQGRVLEIESDTYATKFSAGLVKVDILDIDRNNSLANIIGDLQNLPKISDNTYDCIILTQTLQYIFDLEKAIKECHRILKPNGKLLVTVPAVAGVRSVPYGDLWRFTRDGMARVFTALFDDFEVEGFGNLRVNIKYLQGASQEFCSRKELDYNDARFPMIVSVIAKK